MTDDFDPREDALATYHYAAELAREGHEGVRAWFGGAGENDIIYFVDAHTSIKIGYSSSIRRIQTHKTSGFIPIAVIMGGRIEERELHKSLAGFQKRAREWYEYDDKLWLYIEWLINNKYAAAGDDPSHLPRLPFSVWGYKDPLPFKANGSGQLCIFGAMPPKERVRRLAVGGFLHSLSDDWFTEEQWVERARSALGSIDLDPATHPDVNRRFIKAPVFYTKEIDGLSQSHPWKGNIWLNPPYGDLAPKFFERMRREYECGNITACVTCCSIAAMTTGWFHRTIGSIASMFYIHNTRIQFHKTGSFDRGDAPNQGTLLSYVGRDQSKFVKAFGDAGGIFLQRPLL